MRAHPLILLIAAVSPLISSLAAQTRGFVVRLGTDTFAVERLSRTGDDITGAVVRHTPTTTVLKYHLKLNEAGQVASYEESVFRADGSPAPAGADGVSQVNMRMTFAGDSVIRQMTQNGARVVRTFRAAGVVLPAIGGTSPYWQELVLGATKRSHATSFGLLTFSPGQDSAIVRPVRFIGADSAEMIAGGFRRGFKLDANGHLVRGDGSLTTVKLLITPIADADIDGIARSWTAQEVAGLGMGNPSTRDTLSARVGEATVTIDYGRPAKRGRRIWGALVPFDTVWRFGANEAAQLKTDHDLEIGGTMVAAGSYSIWMYPSAKQSYLILNAVTGQWGTMYDASKDVARIPITPHMGVATGEDRFRVRLNGDKLAMLWDDGGYDVSIRAKHK